MNDDKNKKDEEKDPRPSKDAVYDDDSSTDEGTRYCAHCGRMIYGTDEYCDGCNFYLFHCPPFTS